MLQFIQNLQFFLTFEVLNKNWAVFQERLKSVCMHGCPEEAETADLGDLLR